MDKPKKLGITSQEAAAMLISGGQTSDPHKAAMIAEGRDLDMDGLQKAHLRRMMGVDFRIKIAPNKLHVSTKVQPYVTTWCRIKEGETDKYGHIIEEALMNRLVDACLRLKLKYEATVKKLEATK